MLFRSTESGLHLVLANPKGRGIDRRDRVTSYFQQLEILDIYQGASGLLWFGTEKEGLWSFNKHNGQYEKYLSRALDNKSLLSNKITAVYDDKAEILWIGTNAGINKIDRQAERFNLYDREPTTFNTLSSNNVQSLYKELNGTIWIGTFDGGLNKYEPGRNSYTVYTTDDILVAGNSVKEEMKEKNKKRRRSKLSLPDFISNDRVLALHRDRYRTLWIGTGGSGLDKMNVVTGEITNYRANNNHEDSLSGNIINSIYEDRNGNLWIGTEDGGLNKFDRQKFSRYLHNENDVLSISSNHITAITEDYKNQLWVGTFGGGLNKLNKEEGTFERFTYADLSKTSLSSNAVYCFYADDSSSLWIGTSNGLDHLQIDSMKMSHFTIEDGLPSNFIYGILPDNEGNLWISTNKGIARFDVKSLEFKVFDKKDGLQGNEFNPGAFYRTRNGELLFGGIHGFNAFYPKSIKDNNYIPDIIITDIKILNQSVPIGTPESPLKKHISELDQIVLEHDQNFLYFEFASLNYTDAEKNQYKYMLENFDDDWNDVGNRNFANYTNLPPGEYIFKVQGSNNDNIWNTEGTQLRVIINPPFWRTWWFYFLVLSIILGGIYLLIRQREKNLIRSRMLLREQVKARTEQLSEEKSRVEKAHSEIVYQKNEIENQRNLLMKKNKELTEAKVQLDDANDELKAVNSHLEEIVAERTDKLRETNEQLRISNHELETFIYRASHDLRGPIARLLGLTMVAKLDQNPDYIIKIEENAVNMNRLLDKLTHIHWILKEKINIQPLHFQSFLEEVWQGIDLNGAATDIDLKCDFEKKTLIHSDETHLRIVLKNLLENSVIFRNKKIKTKIECNLKKGRKQYIIEIQDNGIGISELHLPNIFKMFVKGSDQSKGNGLGLYLVEKAVQKLNGQVEVYSEFEKQTRITVYLPIIENKSDKEKEASAVSERH